MPGSGGSTPPTGVNYGTVYLSRAGGSWPPSGTGPFQVRNSFGFYYAWSVSTTETWIHSPSGSRAADGFTPAPAAPGEVISFTYDAYGGSTPRTGYILVTVPTDTTRSGYFTFVQPGVPTFSLSPIVFSFPSAGGSDTSLVAQDLTQTVLSPRGYYAVGAVDSYLYDGWTSSTADSWITITSSSHAAGNQGALAGTSRSDALGFSVAANAHDAPARTGHIVVVVNDAGALSSGTLANDWLFSGTNILTITQAAGPDWVDGGGDGGGGGPDITHGSAVALLQGLRGYWEALVTSTGALVISRAPAADARFTGTYAIDTGTDCAEPSLTIDPASSMLSILYRRGNGTMATPYAFHRRISHDDGKTWVTPSDATATKTGVNGVAHAVNVMNERTGEYLIFYNDESAGGGPGTGLILADVFDYWDNLVGTFPSGGIGGLNADDSSFGALYVREPTSAIDCTFFVGGVKRRFRSYDDARTWVEIT